MGEHIPGDSFYSEPNSFYFFLHQKIFLLQPRNFSFQDPYSNVEDVLKHSILFPLADLQYCDKISFLRIIIR